MGDLLIFDIDGTLFDPEKFGGLVRKHFIKILDIKEEELIRANADYYAELDARTDFNPHAITEFLARRFSGKKEKLDDVFWEDEKIYKESLFDETENALKSLSKNKTLGIFSQGNKELQNRKLKAAGINKFFSEEYVFIHERKLTDAAIELLPRVATVVDDNHDVVLSLKGLVAPIWMNRRSDDNDPEIKTIHDLEELFNYL